MALLCFPHTRSRSLRLSDLMYHTKQKTEVIFMSRKVYRTAIYCRLSREDGDKRLKRRPGSSRAETTLHGMTIWKSSASRSLTMVIAAFPSIVRTSRNSKRRSVRVRLTASWSKTSAAFRETTSTAGAIWKR